MEQEAKTEKEQEEKAKEVSAWKYAMEQMKPKIVKSKEEVEKETKATRELDALENNDATMALAAL